MEKTYQPEGLRRAFGLLPPEPRIFPGSTQPTGCPSFIPHGNAHRHPMCVRCGRPRSAHV